MYKTSFGNLDLSKSKILAAGGEGSIMEHPVHSNQVVKIYHQPRPKKFEIHLWNLRGLPKDTFISPNEVVYNQQNEVVGFTMDYINFNDYWMFNKLYDKGFCNANNITLDYKVAVLNDLKNNLKHLHKNNIVIGDANPYNFCVHKVFPKVLFMDVDSYQTSTQKHSGVLLEDIRDFTTLDINEKTDSWSFDILAFWILSFVHPFRWVVKGLAKTLEQRVLDKQSILSNIPNVIIPKVYSPPTGNVLAQFKQIFNGSRFLVDLDGSTMPMNIVIPPPPVQSQSMNILELMTGVFKVNAAYKQVAVKAGDWTLIDTKTQGHTKKLQVIIADEVFPGNENYAILRGKTLSGVNGKEIYFRRPLYNYMASSLAVIDYLDNTMYNYNIDNQIGGGIEVKTTDIFAKSVLFHDVPVQNLGGKSYLLVPDGSRYRSIPTSQGTKNSYVVDNYVLTESLKNKTVEYSIRNYVTNGASLIFDYYPYFIVKGDMLFLPDDGFINVIQNGHSILKLDATVCTRQSKLYNTGSGILLLENNVLYLCNSK